jgi:hypothetical protein
MSGSISRAWRFIVAGMLDAQSLRRVQAPPIVEFRRRGALD